MNVHEQTITRTSRMALAVTVCMIMVLHADAGVAAAQFPWPVEPFHESHEITGTFCEYRGGVPEHFHNGTDIPKADGSPVYSITDAVVTAIDPTGSAAYVRAGNFAYLHIDPAPGLSIGDSVYAQETILGTILPGAGHVHLNDGQPDEYKNALRAGGLEPYVDTWEPEISNLRFYVQPTRQRVASTELSGRIEITFRVKDPSGPPSTGESRLNNGAYLVGYQVLTADGDSVVYSPGSNGVRFRFDSKPPNAYVHNVFDRLQSSNGRHVYIPTNDVEQASAWDTSELPPGPYRLLLFAEDTHGNRGEFFQEIVVTRTDNVPPPQPTLLSVKRASGRAVVSWSEQPSPDLDGFRVYQADSYNGPWTLVQGEDVLTADSTSYTVPEALQAPQYFYVAAVDSAGNESTETDIYGVAPANHEKSILIVEGFDRTQNSGNWSAPRHDFAGRHGAAVAAVGFGFASAANEAVEMDSVSLSNYDAVIWMVGDESTLDETFSPAEQARVEAYLEAGGQLFVNGSEIAWDLGNRGGTEDKAFLHEYLKVAYNIDDSGSLTATGVAGSIFEGLSFSYGSSPYVEDYPDVYDAVEGGSEALHYGNGFLAAVQYSGSFGAGTEMGKVVTMGFPFETIGSDESQAAVMGSILTFFFPNVAVGVEEPGSSLPKRLSLVGNHPNPFSERTTITFELPQPARATISIFDVLGRRVAVLGGQKFAAGRQEMVWTPQDVASGTYYYRIEAGDEHVTGTLLLAR